MRLIAFIVAALVLSGPASAEWKEFNSVSEGFGVVFPADPDVDEVAMFEVVPGKMLEAHVYSARYDNSLFKMTVVDGRDAGLQEAPVIDQALKRLTQGGELKINVPHRIYRIYGRQVSIARPDGSLTQRGSSRPAGLALMPAQAARKACICAAVRFATLRSNVSDWWNRMASASLPPANFVLSIW